MNEPGNFEYLSTREATRVLEVWLDRLTRKEYDAQVNPMGLRLDDRQVIFPVVLSRPGRRPIVEPYLVRLGEQGGVQVCSMESELMGWSWHSDRIEPTPDPSPAGPSKLARAISTLSRPFRKK